MKEVDPAESRRCRWAASLFSAEARNKFNEGGPGRFDKHRSIERRGSAK